MLTILTCIQIKYIDFFNMYTNEHIEVDIICIKLEGKFKWF